MSVPHVSFDKQLRGDQPRRRMAGKVRPAARDLRSEGHLLGLPDLARREARQVENDNAVVHFYKAVIEK